MFGPMSERVGSRNFIVASMVMSVACHLVVGLASNIRTVLFGRYLAGLFGSVPIAIAPRVAFDICSVTQRATAVVALTVSLSLGPILGVIGGEFALLVPTSTWRWTMWASVISSVLSICFAFVILPGNGSLLVRSTRAVRHRQMSKDARDRPAIDTSPLGPKGAVQSPKHIAVAMSAILVYGLLHMLLLVYPMSFEIDRAFPFGVSSLPFLAVIAGILAGGARLTRESTRLQPRRKEKTWTSHPERVMVSGSYTLATGLFLFAWTSHRDTSPWPQILSGIITGYGVRAIGPADISKLTFADHHGSCPGPRFAR